MKRSITKAQVLGKAPLDIHLRLPKEQESFSIAERIFHIFHDPVVYQVQHDEVNDVVYVSSKARSRGLPKITVDKDGRVRTVSAVSKGSSFEFFQLEKPDSDVPVPTWDKELPEPLPVFEDAKPAPPTVSRALYPKDALDNIKCSRLTESLVEIFAVLQKERRNNTLRTWTYGLTAAGTYVAVNELDRFIVFPTRDLLQNYESRQRTWFTSITPPAAKYVDTNQVCVMDCLQHLEIDEHLAELQVFHETVPDYSTMKIAWKLLKISNGHYAVVNNRHNAAWFIHPQMSVVLAHMKDESRFAFSSNNRYTTKWISDSLDISVVK
jgi:hypothetical protein